MGRIPVQHVTPLVDGGSRPAKSVVDEQFTVGATVFREGHDAVSATVVLLAPDGTEHSAPMTCTNAGLNTWEAVVAADAPGLWSYRVEGWSDPYATWDHDASIKVAADVDAELMLEEGAQVIERAISEVARTPAEVQPLEDAVTALRDPGRPPMARLRAGTDPAVRAELRARPLRDFVTPSPALPLLVERERALYGAWYELFPRSEGATRDPETGTWTTGTLRTAARRLPAIAAMGFDVVYLTPVHPIGTTNRKGRNNSLECAPDDPGSPYAIGNEHGGQDSIEPSLGTFADFDAFVAEAERLDLEVALDIALNCSPDHPYVTSHPEWFTTKADGSIAHIAHNAVPMDETPIDSGAAVKAVLEVNGGTANALGIKEGDRVEYQAQPAQ